MKLTFQGDTLTEIHQQIIAAADELTREDIKMPDIKFNGVKTAAEVSEGRWDKAQPHIAAMQESMVADHSQIPENAFPGVDWAKRTNQPVENLPFAQPQSDGHVPAGTQSTKIDGYNVSDGKVWVPVEGRGSAYRGVPIDDYLKQKAAKESGGELDAAGTPYNPAIHTSTKAKTNKGLWKNRPGGGAAKSETQLAPTVENMTNKLTEMVQENPPATVQQVVAHEDSQPAIGRAPSMHNYESFKTNLMTIVVRLINENKITRDYMKDLNAYFQVSNLWDVKNDDTKCQQLFKLFLEYQFIMGA